MGSHSSTALRWALTFLCAACLCSFPRYLLAQATLADEAVATPGLDVEIGLAGVWKLGHPCPVHVSIPPQFADATHLEVVSVDGDGVEVAYRTELAAAQSSAAINVRIGREQAELTARLFTGETLLEEVRLDPSSKARQLDASQPLIVAIGSTMGIEDLILRSPGGKENFSTAAIQAAAQLPTEASGLSSCDLILISTSNRSLLAEISPPQWSAIRGWIGSGGGCIISLGGSASQLAALEPLQELIPGKLINEATILNPGPLESLVVTDEPLDPFPAIALELRDVRIDLPLSDSASRRIPWWSTYASGHGTIRLIASDLDHPSLAKWKDRRLLWERLIEPYFSRTMIEAPEKEADLAQASAYLGYSDVVGQLRAMLDRFASIKVVSFGQISALLIATLLLVGPIDYLVSVKWLNRPQFSWIFSGMALIGISIGLTLYYQSIRPDAVLVNSAELIDVDLATDRIRGDVWFNIYSSEADRFDITAQTLEKYPVELDWQGLPGGGLGGLSSQLSIDRGMPMYHIESQPTGGTQLLGVGIPAGGTKSLVGQWMTELSSSGIAIQAPDIALQELTGVDQLQGYFTNPLQIDLRNATLFYHDWYYILNNRITAGEKVVISASEIPKDVSRRLNRRKNVDGSVSITRWDPADRDNLDGLLELMMFYKAASGVNYASLAHRFQPRTDHSNLLELDKAVLLAQIDVSPVTLKVGRGSEPAVEVSGDADQKSRQELSRVWCRIVLPVQGK